ncbi:hypothetical protein CAEBREN_20314 [Caenorhabditis brenneri]|uniref:Uncharacterized protein n=1 Tax=Caenorhabditis brenneri TaxID=135651 RepID=G0P1H1_CAEBE|nr:hypothetical protein CAEBREN_20314 [Caenorhabditis brenneri]
MAKKPRITSASYDSGNIHGRAEVQTTDFINLRDDSDSSDNDFTVVRSANPLADISKAVGWEDNSDSDEDFVVVQTDLPLKDGSALAANSDTELCPSSSQVSTPTATHQKKTIQVSPTDSIILRLPMFISAQNLKFQSTNRVNQIDSIDEPGPTKKLKTFETQRNDNIEIFLHFFESSIKWRECHEKSRNSFLPNFATFSTFFRDLMRGCPSLPQHRLANVNSNTIRRAASSAVFFLWYCEEKKKCVRRDGETIEKASLHWISNLNSAQKAEVVAEFACWYSTLPPARISATKLVAASFISSRVNVKETSTLFTVVRGLMAYFTYIGCIGSSYCRRPTDESKTIWATVKQTLISMEKNRGGALETSQHPLSLQDIIVLMLRTDGVKTLSGIQSWLFSMVIADFGLRVSSIRNRWEKGFWLLNPDLDNDDCDDDGRANEPEDDCVCGAESVPDCVCSINDNKTSVEEEDLDVDFDSIKIKDVVVWKRKSEKSDPPGSIRIRVTLSVSSTKTTGQKFFKPELLGSSYPKVLPDGTFDWSPNAAIALTALLVINDSMGYAKTIVSSVVCRGDSQRIFLENDAKMCLLSSDRWRSNQSELYIRSVMVNLKSHGRTDAGITAFDWQTAIFYSSPQNKTKYEHVRISELLEKLVELDPKNEATIRAGWKNQTTAQKRHIQNTINSFNYKNSPAPSIPDEEMRKQLEYRPILNVAETFKQLEVIRKWNLNSMPFSGFGRKPLLSCVQYLTVLFHLTTPLTHQTSIGTKNMRVTVQAVNSYAQCVWMLKFQTESHFCVIYGNDILDRRFIFNGNYYDLIFEISSK